MVLSSSIVISSSPSRSPSPSKFKFSLRILNSFSFSFSSLSTTDHDRLPLPLPNDDENKPSTAIDRIVLRLRNLASQPQPSDPIPIADHFLRREWLRPDQTAFPLQKEEQEDKESVIKNIKYKNKKKEVKAPHLEFAEATLGVEELRRLQTLGINLKVKVSVPKAGLTRPVLQKIHHQWNTNELVKLKVHEILAENMNLAHHIVERRTGGLVIWRSGSVMWVYRGKNYQEATTTTRQNLKQGDEKSDPVVWSQRLPEKMTAEEVEFDRMLDDFGPRYVDWWGTGILPVDADLLPPIVPGYKSPLRILPTRMHSRTTNDEVTNMRKLAKALPCHFALGRNRNLQGLACAILKLWEKSLVAKIAVKRGIQNTNNELMAEELKKLTGGTLLLRNKFHIVIYRGKDFVPTGLAAALSERPESTKHVQVVEKKVRCRPVCVDATPSREDESTAQAETGSLDEFYKAQAQWRREISTEEHEKTMKEAAGAKNVGLIKKIERKLTIAQSKRIKAEKLLAKLEASLVPAGSGNHRDTITDEERIMLRAVGLRTKAYLQFGTHGVFSSVIENMHLHWRHRELVKLITKQKTIASVEDTARLLEYVSGGILVAIDRLPKGFSLIYYRGKDYRRTITLRPRNLFMKAKTFQRSIAMQRHEALSQHLTDLVGEIEEMKKELSEDEYFDGDDSDGNFDDAEDSDRNDEESKISGLELWVSS